MRFEVTMKRFKSPTASFAAFATAVLRFKTSMSLGGAEAVSAKLTDVTTTVDNKALGADDGNALGAADGRELGADDGNGVGSRDGDFV